MIHGLVLPVGTIWYFPGFGGGTRVVALRVLNTVGVIVRNKFPSVPLAIWD